MKDERFVLTEEDIIFQEDKKRINRLNKILNSQKENLDYRYDVKAYKEYLKEWLKHKDEKEYLNGGVLSFAEFWEHDIDYEFEDYKKILKLIDEHNKKKELVTNGGPGSGNHNPGQGRGVGKPADSIDVSKYSTYEDFEQDMFRGENRKENIEKLKEQGINSKDKMYLYFVNEKFKKQKITQMSLDEAKDTILENIPKSVAEGWFIKADSSYKKKIVQLIVENDNLRSASLSLAYETYKELVNKNIGFNDFLNKKLDLYRGDSEGKKFIEADRTSFISYTPFEDMAKKFGKVITKKTIKPKETLGVLRQVGEFEFLVPTFNQKKDVHKSKNTSVRMNDLLQKMDKILNGGPGSGNFNPGQGRGVGKPASGVSSSIQYSASNYLPKKEYENIVNYSSEDNFTEEELDAIASYAKSMGYGASCDLNQAIRENDFGEIIERENVVYPEDDSQIVTWKENKEFIEQKIKDKKEYDSLNQEIQLAASVLRKGGLSDEKETEKLRVYVSDMQKERDNLSKTLKYSEYENYIKNYEKGLYKDLKDDQKMWTIDEDKLSKISVVKLREKQKSEQKRFDEVLEIPRLMWSMYYDDKPTTTDTLANKYQRDFKDLDKLDNIIKNKGFVLDKDITVTRRVANAKVIENQIKNKGEYTQNGITSVTAAKSIGKKMPSGVHMGNDLLRITIPAGTRVISTYNPFVRDTQKSADKYNGGKLSEEDNRNLRMIKGQNELILPSGSKFVSPNGNSISKNEDGSYQLILKAEGKISNNRTERLNFLQEIFNGGKGSGNFNPGQGRGIGKPGKGSNATNVYEKYKDRKNPKPKSLSDSERELRIGTIINNAERMGINLEDIKEDDAYKIMKFIGWEENENGTISTEFGLEKISDKEVKDNDYIVFNGTDSKDGFDSLRDGGYRSRIIDENDGPGIYTSEYYDVALEYSKGEGDRAHKERITPIRIDNSNIISRDDVNKKLRNFNRNFLKNLPDSAVAALAGYDAMWTGNSDKEVVILKPGSAEIIELDEK